MDQKTEQINLEYKVGFEDGLRPKLNVYGISNREIRGAIAYFGVIVGAGNRVEAVAREKEGKKQSPNEVQVVTGANTQVYEVVHSFKTKVPETDGWEQEVCDRSRTMGFNVIKVQDPKHIQFAINRHREAYGEQFTQLTSKYMELFDSFVKEHPGYIQF